MIDRSILNLIESAKAYAGALGSFITGLLGLGVLVGVPPWLVAVGTVLTWFSVWKVPNAAPAEPAASRHEPEAEVY